MDLCLITADWPYDKDDEAANVRKVVGVDGAMKVQLRIPSGVIQWELEGRPDGQRPYGCRTVLEHCRRMIAGARRRKAPTRGPALLTPDLVEELAEEMFDYSRRCRALLLLHDYRHARDDAAHGLGILDLVVEHSDPDVLVFRYDRYRPSLLLDRTRAEMLMRVRAGRMRQALKTLSRGIGEIERFYAEYEMQEQLGESPERQILVDLRRSLRERYHLPLDDQELLQSLRAEQEIAIAKENYEMAARLRDKIRLLRQRIGDQQ